MKLQFVDSIEDDYSFETEIVRSDSVTLVKAQRISDDEDVLLWIKGASQGDQWEDRMIAVFSNTCSSEVFCFSSLIKTNLDKTVLEANPLNNREYTLKSLLQRTRLYRPQFNLSRIVHLYEVLLQGIDFFNKKGFHHGNIRDYNILFSAKKIKIGGFPKLIPLKKTLPPKDRDTFHISKLIAMIIGEKAICLSDFPSHLKKALRIGIQQKSDVHASDLLRILKMK